METFFWFNLPNQCFYSVLILPTRNGNWQSFKKNLWKWKSSYPTYEEWKPWNTWHSVVLCDIRSYPTYEEWKQGLKKKEIGNTFCSYPTYEEWKPIITLLKLIDIYIVLILPTRNGNISGNSFFINLDEFLSYLRGMETPYVSKILFFVYRSYPTYEEWKQSKYYCIISWFLSSYPTYEEWKQTSDNNFRFLPIHVLILPTRNGNILNLLCIQ